MSWPAGRPRAGTGCVQLSQWQQDFPQAQVQSSKPTSADGAISHVARLAGTAVSLDCVGTDGILVAVVLSTATIVMFCRVGEEEKRSVFTRVGTAGLAGNVCGNSPTRMAVTRQPWWIMHALDPSTWKWGWDKRMLSLRQAWETEELPLWIYCLCPSGAREPVMCSYLSLRGWPSMTVLRKSVLVNFLCDQLSCISHDSKQTGHALPGSNSTPWPRSWEPKISSEIVKCIQGQCSIDTSEKPVPYFRVWQLCDNINLLTTLMVSYLKWDNNNQFSELQKSQVHQGQKKPGTEKPLCVVVIVSPHLPSLPPSFLPFTFLLSFPLFSFETQSCLYKDTKFQRGKPS